MEDPKKKTENIKSFHPSFYQCLPVFFVPLPLFLFAPLGVRLYYILILFWFLEMSFLLFIWIYLSTTLYIIKPDRLEIRTGVFVKRSRTVPFDQVVNITSKQTLFQKLFGIGDLFIDTAGGKPLEVALAGVERHRELKDYLFALMKSGTE